MKNSETSIIFKLHIAEICNTKDILSQTSIRNFRQTTLGLDVEEMDKSFSSIPTAGAAMEVMTYIFKHLDSEKAINVSSMKAISLKHSLIQKLMSNHPYESYKNHELLKNYKIIQEPGFFQYIFDREIIRWTVDKTPLIPPNILTKIQVMCSAFQCSVLNRKDETAKDIFKYIIVATNLYFNHFAKEIKQYIKCAEYILPVLKLIEPESTLKIIQALVPYIKFSFDLSGKFSDLLNFKEAKALLEESNASLELLEKLASREGGEANYERSLLNTNTEKKILGEHYYRVACAYEKTEDYNMSTKYYKHAFSLLPTHTAIAFNLWSNYRIQGEFDNAKDLIKYVSEGYIKYFLEMLTNPYEISYEKLDLIEKNTLSPFYLSLYNGCEYMAFYNQIANKQTIPPKQQTKLTKKLNEIINSSSNILLSFSLALCSKQFKKASDLLNKMPEHQINLYEKAIINLRSYMDPNYTLPQNNTLKPNEKVEVLNAVNTTLIADNETKLTSEKSEKIFQNVENALQNDSCNESTLEIGVVTALLNNNQEKVQKYARKLSPKKQEEIINSYSLDNKQVENLEQLTHQYDAKKIHEYYQLKKKHEFHLIMHKIGYFNKNSWNIPKEGQIKIDNQEVTQGTAILLGKYRGFDCYGTISKKIYDRFDKSKIMPFVSALKKGIIHHKHGTNGVKLIKKNAFKVKYDGEDDRLLTSILYSNEQGKLLLNFDEYGNHDEVKKFVIGHRLEFFNVE